MSAGAEVGQPGLLARARTERDEGPEALGERGRRWQCLNLRLAASPREKGRNRMFAPKQVDTGTRARVCVCACVRACVCVCVCLCVCVSV